MKTTTHTPAPWYINSGQLYNEQTGNTIAHMIDDSPQTARLIAAAPEMYEILTQVRQHSDKLPEHIVKEIANVLYNINKPADK